MISPQTPQLRSSMRQVVNIAKTVLTLFLPIVLGGTATYFEMATAWLTQRELLLINALEPRFNDLVRLGVITNCLRTVISRVAETVRAFRTPSDKGD